MIASDSCPESEITTTSYILIHNGGFLSEFDDEFLYKAIPNAVRTDLTADQFVANTQTFPVHSDGAIGVFEMKESARAMIQTVQQYLFENRVDKETKNMLERDIQQLEQKLSGFDYSEIENAMHTLMRDFNNASRDYYDETDENYNESNDIVVIDD